MAQLMSSKWKPQWLHVLCKRKECLSVILHLTLAPALDYIIEWSGVYDQLVLYQNCLWLSGTATKSQVSLVHISSTSEKVKLIWSSLFSLVTRLRHKPHLGRKRTSTLAKTGLTVCSHSRDSSSACRPAKFVRSAEYNRCRPSCLRLEDIKCYRSKEAKEILWQYFIKEGRLTELSKLAFAAIVTTFPWQQKFKKVLFYLQHLWTISHLTSIHNIWIIYDYVMKTLQSFPRILFSNNGWRNLNKSHWFRNIPHCNGNSVVLGNSNLFAQRNHYM